MSTNMENKKSTWVVNTGRMLGAIGAVLLVSVPLTWGLSQEIAFQGLVTWKLIIALVCEAIYLLTNKDTLRETLRETLRRLKRFPRHVPKNVP